jgi:class 3 adenylate cyclase
MLAAETTALLFTDLVGSTELITGLSLSESEALRAEHFDTLRDAVARTGGREVKNLGDGLMVAFRSTGGAVQCALAMQQAVDRANRGADRPLSVRIGISVGDVATEDGDLFGTPVIEAARLCAAAGGGEVLVSEPVRALASGADAPDFEPLGPLALKGLPGPVNAFRVLWAPLDADDDRVPLPPRLVGVPATGFIGRDAERAVLDGALARARAGQRTLMLVAGEPGIGKTRLATQLGVGAFGQGDTVLYGRCDADVGVPYQPWVEALTHLVAKGPDALIDRHVREHGAELARLVPELARRRPGVAASETADPETERWLLYGAVVGLLGLAARDGTVVLILDDLHWAGRPTVSLLRHLLLTAPPVRLLVVATYRAAEMGRGDPFGTLLADVAREEGVERVALEGLGEPEVAALVGATAGQELDHAGRRLAHELWHETAGNPFFLAELMRHLVESGAVVRGDDGRWVITQPLAQLGLPPSVRDAIGARIERLGARAERVLGIASVIGRDFDLDLLALVAGDDEDELLDVLEPAVAAALLAEAPGRAGRFTFAHALISHTLYEQLSRTRRARLHRRVAEALEELCGDDPGDRVGELAHHWAAATQVAEVDRALGYATRAGEQALERLAPEEAARWFGQALELGEDEARRRELLVWLGEAQRQAGDAAFRQTLLDAAALAREANDGEVLVRAALANNRGFFSAVGVVDEERVGALEAALLAAPRPHPRRAGLLAILAAELLWHPDADRRRALSDEALALARAGDDAATLVRVLALRTTAIWTPATLDARLANTAEAVALVDGLGDPLLRFWAYVWRLVTVMQVGHVDEVDACLEQTGGIAERLAQPTLRFVHNVHATYRAHVAGDLALADQLSAETLAVGVASGQADALSLAAPELVALRREQGRLAEFADVIAQTAEQFPAVSLYAALDGLTCLELGRAHDARRRLGAMAVRGFDVPQDPLTLAALVHWADVAAGLPDPGAALLLHARLEPFADQVVCNATAVWGSVRRPLGRLAAALGRDAEADRHFAAALDMHQRMRAPVFTALTRVDWAEALRARGERARARDLATAAAAELDGLGALPLERRAGDVLSSPLHSDTRA